MSLRRLFVMLLVALAVPAHADVPVPALEGPVTGGNGSPFLATTTFDFASVGYVQEEFFLSGTASAYVNVGPLGTDGKWTVTPGATAAYKTRMVVYRPANRKRFNGTVIIEWLNVSGGIDAAPDWLQAHTGLVREGFAWVGVSAQYLGIEGGPGLVPIPGVPTMNVKSVDPARYGSLFHPGDGFSYDIYSQTGAALRSPPSGIDPLGGLKAKRFIAAGESQSAFRMVNYINAVHPIARVYDGYLVHSRGSIAPTPASESLRPPGNALIRDDVDVPVLEFQTEGDVFALLSSVRVRQDDTDRFRLWEVAGTAHADTYTVDGMADVGKDPAVVAPVISTSVAGGLITCDHPLNSGPQHFVLNAAFVALERWVRKGTPPPRMPRLDTNPGPPPTLVLDAHGNGSGGVRTPQLDVPIATFTGSQPPGSSILCLLFGTTTPFDEATLRALYPTHRDFVSKYAKAIKRAVKSGAVLKADARLMRRWAAGSDIGRP
jgi:hypothetical protein